MKSFIALTACTVMEIPAIYSVLKNGEIKAAPVTIEGADIFFVSEPVPPAYAADELGDRAPLLVADVKGLSKKELDDRLLMNMKFPGSDIWFLTYIRDIEDVFDCFMGNVAKMLIPYHTTRNDVVMEEAYEVTENCIPVLFVSRGKVVCRGGQTKDIGQAVGELERIGFGEIIVFDTDSMLSADDWISLRSRSAGVIPFIRAVGAAAGDAGFEKIIFDF